MLLIRMMAGAVFLHEALYLCRDGREYLTRCFVPTFGLQLSPRLHGLAHLSLMTVCLALVCVPGGTALYPLCLCLLTVVIASYSLRLSNHLILSWFMLLVLCIAASLPLGDPDTRLDFLRVGVAGLVLLTYGLACFHKLNAEYFSLEQSCVSQLTEFYCWDRSVQDRHLVRRISLTTIYGTVLMEGAIPLLLLNPVSAPIGLLVGLSFHFALALLGIVNFSAVMYAGLLAFVPPAAIEAFPARVTSLGLVPVAGVCGTFVLLVWRLTPRWANRHCPYQARSPAWALQFGFGVITALAYLLCLDLFGTTYAPEVGGASLSGALRLILVAIWLTFLLNGLSPYLGLKTEFSFAMFSNLRCQPWQHLIVPARWRIFHRCDYVKVEAIEGLPTPEQLRGDSAALLALRVLSQPASFRYSRYFFREAVCRLLIAAHPVPRLRVRYQEQGEQRELDSQAPTFKQFSRGCLRANLFPFVLPVDPTVSHSEQGTILRGSQERQLF